MEQKAGEKATLKVKLPTVGAGAGNACGANILTPLSPVLPPVFVSPPRASHGQNPKEHREESAVEI